MTEPNYAKVYQLTETTATARGILRQIRKTYGHDAERIVSDAAADLAWEEAGSPQVLFSDWYAKVYCEGDRSGQIPVMEKHVYAAEKQFKELYRIDIKEYGEMYTHQVRNLLGYYNCAPRWPLAIDSKQARKIKKTVQRSAVYTRQKIDVFGQERRYECQQKTPVESATQTSLLPSTTQTRSSRTMTNPTPAPATSVPTVGNSEWIPVQTITIPAQSQ